MCIDCFIVGFQYEQFTCVDTEKGQFSDGFCSDQSKPSGKKDCNNHPCGAYTFWLAHVKINQSTGDSISIDLYISDDRSILVDQSIDWRLLHKKSAVEAIRLNWDEIKFYQIMYQIRSVQIGLD